jgi:hypothetical protein
MAAWLAALAARGHGWRAAALAPARAWEHSWAHLSVLAAARVFTLATPVAVPAGLILAGLA